MRRLMFVFFAVLLMVGSADIIAKRGGSSFRRSTSKSFSKKTTTKKTVAPKKTRTDNKSTIKKKASTKKPKAVSKNKMDKKQTKAMRSKNTAAAKKYGNKKTAAKAYKTDMVKKNNYSSSTAPKTRPANIPQTVVIAGNPGIAVGYHSFGGYYGYGYMDPVTQVYMALATQHMLVNDMAMQRGGYGHWNANGAPVVYRDRGALAIVLWAFIIIIGLGVIIFICVNASKMFRK